MVKTKKYTISDIAFHNAEVERFYFSKATLKCFGQIRGMFKVLHKGGRVFIYAPHGNRTPGKGSYSFAEYIPKTGAVKSVRKPADVMQWKSAEQIKAHIKELTK
jgi:hypothetical protein